MPTKTTRTKNATKQVQVGINVSERGNYQVTFGRGPLHEWLITQAAKRGCGSIPEFVKRMAQEAFEKAQQAAASP